MRDGSAEVWKRAGTGIELRKRRGGRGEGGGEVKTDRGRRKKCEGRKELSDNAEGSAEL